MKAGIRLAGSAALLGRPVYGGEAAKGDGKEHKTPIFAVFALFRGGPRPFSLRSSGVLCPLHDQVSAYYTTLFNSCQQFLIVIAHLSPQVLVRQRFRSPVICPRFRACLRWMGLCENSASPSWQRSWEFRPGAGECGQEIRQSQKKR